MPGDLSTAECNDAAALVAFTAIARLHTNGRASERWVVGKVVEIAQRYFDRNVTTLPLGQLFALDDGWEQAGDARTKSYAPSSGRPA